MNMQVETAKRKSSVGERRFARERAWALYAPVVLSDRQWPCADWIKEALPLARMLHLGEHYAKSNDPVALASELDVLAHLQSACMEAPMPSEYVHIFLHLGAKMMEQWQGATNAWDVTAAPRELSRYERLCLLELQGNIYRKQMNALDTPGKKL